MKAFRILFIICALGVMVFSCKKDHRELSSAVQPESDELVTSPGQKYPVYVHTIYHDPIVSLNDNFKYLGSNKDGNYGTTTVGLYLNATLSETVKFEDSAIYRKAELVFPLPLNSPINGVIGSLLSYSVFTLDSSLAVNRAYFSNKKDLHNKDSLVCVASVSISGTGTSGDPHYLRLPLDSAYGKRIFRDNAHLNPDDFLDVYKGFYIVASANGGEGVLFQCDLDQAESGLVISYKQGPKSGDKTYRFPFSGSKSVKFNTMTFEPGTEISAQLAGDSALGADRAYLRGMGATRMRVYIPFLKNRSDSFAYSVNRAEITIHVDPNVSQAGYRPPTKISLLPADSLGREILTVDQRTNTYIGRYDGYLRESVGKTVLNYVFNIPLHAQQILNGTRKNYGFYLVMADPAPPTTARRDNYMERIVFAGHMRSVPPELNISYTRVGKE